jgi:hypothetical protein
VEVDSVIDLRRVRAQLHATTKRVTTSAGASHVQVRIKPPARSFVSVTFRRS